VVCKEGVWSVSEIYWTVVVLHVTGNKLKVLPKTDRNFDIEGLALKLSVQSFGETFIFFNFLS